MVTPLKLLIKWLALFIHYLTLLTNDWHYL